MSDARAWALILAAGEGSRLRTLTTTASGLSVPKQFCSLRGGRALLEEAVRRASAVAPLERICLVVAAQHRRWWAPLLDTLPPENVIEQPENRGTAYGILLPLLQIAACDSAATVVVFPADHYVRDEAALAIALREAVAIAGADRDAACLLGVEPDEPDTELGYIVPAERRYHRASAVVEFIEKPFLNRACALLDQGALWNVFILASSAKALLALYESRFDSTIARLRAVIASCRHEPLRAAATAAIYRDLQSLDFSRDVLEGQEAALRVLRVPDCGWTDLGTLPRVARTLYRLPNEALAGRSDPNSFLRLNLAVQHSLLKTSGKLGFHPGAA